MKVNAEVFNFLFNKDYCTPTRCNKCYRDKDEKCDELDCDDYKIKLLRKYIDINLVSFRLPVARRRAIRKILRCII